MLQECSRHMDKNFILQSFAIILELRSVGFVKTAHGLFVVCTNHELSFRF